MIEGFNLSLSFRLIEQLGYYISTMIQSLPSVEIVATLMMELSAILMSDKGYLFDSIISLQSPHKDAVR